MTARLYYWYLTHPRWGRPALLVAVLQALSITAVCAAPQASAATNASILNFTGLKDTYGVPIGDYYLSLASVRDQITQAGPDVGWNPQSWMNWFAHTLWIMMSSVSIANWLTAEAGLFIGIIALALWVMKITVSTYWLTVIGEIARAIATAVIQATSQIGLLVLAVPIGVFAGVTTIRRGEAGRGWTMILVALTMPALSVAVFADPAGMMYGQDGLLAFGRRVGFSVAEAATHNGSAGGPDALTASLITHTVREPLQLWNFGHVVDRVGSCGAAWSAAVRTGVSDGPVKAMAACGDRGAVVYAQHLDGSNLWTGAVFVFAAVLLGVFMVVSGWAVLTVSVRAIWTTAILLPSLWVGSVPGAPQRRALDVVWQFFRHGIEVMVYIIFVSVIGLAVERIVSNPLPAELGGANPFAHVLMMGALSIVAFMLLRHIRADLSGMPRGERGMVGRATDVALGLGMHAALGGAASAAVAGAKGLRGRFGNRGATPWERQDHAADNAAAVHGPPQPGVDPVPNTTDEAASGVSPAPDAGPPSTPAPQGEPPQADGGGGAATVATLAPEPGQLGRGGAAVAPILDGLTRPLCSRERRLVPRAPQPAPCAPLESSAGAALAGGPASPAPGADQPTPVAPITEAAFSNGEPLPPEPPPEDAAPPADDGQKPTTQPTTVDPINDN